MPFRPDPREGAGGLALMNSPNTPASIDQYLYTVGFFLPDPDLIIRTSGEVRGYRAFCYAVHSEFYFTDVYWPEFRKVDPCARFARSNRGRAAWA